MNFKKRSGISGTLKVVCVIILFSVVLFLGLYTFAYYASVSTTVVGTVQYSSTVDGTTTLIINNSTIVCSLTVPRVLTQSIWTEFKTYSSPAIEIVNLKVGQTVSMTVAPLAADSGSMCLINPIDSGGVYVSPSLS